MGAGGFRVEVTRAGGVAMLQVSVDEALRTRYALVLDEYAASRFATVARAQRFALIAGRRFPGARIDIVSA